MANERVFKMPFGGVYPLYVKKVERKGRTKEELDVVLTWLTGYTVEQLQEQADAEVSFAEFFDQAPAMTPHVDKITGVVCGVRVEDVEHPLMQKIRWMDKIVDELAKGKAIEKILRS